MAPPLSVDTDKKLSLNPCFNRLSFTQHQERCFITLYFKEGTLDITADVDEGILSSAWRYKSKPGPKIERHSWGKMNEAIRIQRNHGENWRDDTLLDQQNKAIISFSLGRVCGADTSQDKPDCVYLATNQAKIIGINRLEPDTPLWYSDNLEGNALDVLMLKVPGQTADSILAPTNNGLVYLLSPNVKGDAKNSIKPLYVQLVETRITRCIGWGTQNILALDSLNQLSPLLLSNPEQFWQQRDDATQKLTDYFFIQNEHTTELSPDLYRLLLEFFLFSLTSEEAFTKELQLFSERYAELNHSMFQFL